jgi:hypothetical protein
MFFARGPLEAINRKILSSTFKIFFRIGPLHFSINRDSRLFGFIRGWTGGRHTYSMSSDSESPTPSESPESSSPSPSSSTHSSPRPTVPSTVPVEAEPSLKTKKSHAKIPSSKVPIQTVDEDAVVSGIPYFAPISNSSDSESAEVPQMAPVEVEQIPDAEVVQKSGKKTKKKKQQDELKTKSKVRAPFFVAIFVPFRSFCTTFFLVENIIVFLFIHFLFMKLRSIRTKNVKR